MSDTPFIITLIENVEKHPCLWDTMSQSYSKRDKLEKAWQEIAEECQKSVSFCREKWKNVRTGFLRSLREYPENNRFASSKRKPFYLHEAMKFLLPLRNDTSKTNISNVSNFLINNSSENEIVRVVDSSNSELLDYEELDNFEMKMSEQKEGYFSQFGPSSSNKSETSQKHEFEYEPPHKKLRVVTNELEQIGETKEEIALMSFFRGIAPDVLSLSVQNQRFLKRKLVELVDDLHKADEQTHRGIC